MRQKCESNRAFLLFILGFSLAFRSHAAQGVVLKETTYSGMCDASAGVILTDDLFLVADDELNILRVYSLSRGGAPLSSLHLNVFLEVQKGSPEADIEGAARVGDLVYLISSHGRNKAGRERGSRERFFAAKITSTNDPHIQVFGVPYKKLLDDLVGAPALKKYRINEASLLTPKEKGALNIEGLAAGPDGSLLIGFRNPLHKKKALIVPLLNPADLVAGKGPAQFGKPIELDLDGNGIRDFVLAGSDYYLIGGSYKGGGASEIYHWDGKSPEADLLYRWEPHIVNAEAIMAMPGKPGELLILSDDGSKRKLGIECKELPEFARHFRSILLQTR